MKSPKTSGLAVEISRSAPWLLTNSVTVSRNLVSTSLKYSVRWMIVILPADPTGRGAGVLVGATVGAVVATSVAASVIAGASVAISVAASVMAGASVGAGA